MTDTIINFLVLLYFIGFEDLIAMFMKGSFFWDIAPRSLLKIKWRFDSLASCFILISCLAYSSTLKTEEKCSPKHRFLSADYTALYSKRQNRSYILFRFGAMLEYSSIWLHVFSCYVCVLSTLISLYCSLQPASHFFFLFFFTQSVFLKIIPMTRYEISYAQFIFSFCHF